MQPRIKYWIPTSHLPHIKHNKQNRYSKEASDSAHICMMVFGHCAQSTKHVTYQHISCYHWPTGCNKHQTYVQSHYNILLPVLLLFFWNNDARYRGGSKGLPLIAVCLPAGLCGVYSKGMHWKGFQWYGKAFVERKYKRGWRFHQSSILIYSRMKRSRLFTVRFFLTVRCGAVRRLKPNRTAP